MTCVRSIRRRSAAICPSARHPLPTSRLFNANALAAARSRTRCSWWIASASVASRLIGGGQPGRSSSCRQHAAASSHAARAGAAQRQRAQRFDPNAALERTARQPATAATRAARSHARARPRARRARRSGRAPAPRARRRVVRDRRDERAAAARSAPASDSRSSRLCSSTSASGCALPVRMNWKYRAGISKPGTSPTRARAEQLPFQRDQRAAEHRRSPSPEPPRRVQHVHVRQSRRRATRADERDSGFRAPARRTTCR